MSKRERIRTGVPTLAEAEGWIHAHHGNDDHWYAVVDGEVKPCECGHALFGTAAFPRSPFDLLNDICIDSLEMTLDRLIENRESQMQHELSALFIDLFDAMAKLAAFPEGVRDA